jgi:hypothetical protein
MGCAIYRQWHVSMSAFAGFRWEIPATSSRSARAFRNCGSITARATVYFVRRGTLIIVLLCGGDKRTQDRDIAAAKKMAREV